MSLTIIVSVHLSEDLICPFLGCGFILGHLHHRWHHLVNCLSNAERTTAVMCTFIPLVVCVTIWGSENEEQLWMLWSFFFCYLITMLLWQQKLTVTICTGYKASVSKTMHSSFKGLWLLRDALPHEYICHRNKSSEQIFSLFLTFIYIHTHRRLNQYWYGPAGCPAHHIGKVNIAAAIRKNKRLARFHDERWTRPDC